MDFQPIRNRLDDIFKGLEVALQEAEALEKKKAGIEDYEREVRDLEKRVLADKQIIEDREKEVNAKEAGLTHKREELLAQERKLNKYQNILSEVKENVRIMDERLVEVKAEEELLKEKKQEIQSSTKKLELDTAKFKENLFTFNTKVEIEKRREAEVAAQQEARKIQLDIRQASLQKLYDELHSHPVL